MQQENMISEKKEKISQILDLPPLPRIAQQILQEVSNEYVEIDHLAEVIAQDPGLLARIIGIANSAFYGCPDRIYTVADAIIKVLGLNMVKSLALGVALNSPLSSARCPGFQLDQYWFTSMHSAYLAKTLSARMQWDAEETLDHVYLCGLLHNLGVLVLVFCFPVQMGEVFSRLAEDEEADLVALEEEILGIAHPEAGAILARTWHLPSDVITVMENHYNSDYRGEGWQLSLLVGLCMHVARLDCDEIGDSVEVEKYRLSLGLELPEVQQVCKEVMSRRQEIIGLACVLSLD